MLPSSHRLSSRDITLIMEKGRVVHSTLFIVRWVPGEDHARIAAIAPVKVAKTAVGRNALRRKIYRGVQNIYPHIIPGIKAAVLAKSGAVTATPETIQSDLMKAFKAIETTPIRLISRFTLGAYSTETARLHKVFELYLLSICTRKSSSALFTMALSVSWMYFHGSILV